MKPLTLLSQQQRKRFECPFHGDIWIKLHTSHSGFIPPSWKSLFHQMPEVLKKSLSYAQVQPQAQRLNKCTITFYKLTKKKDREGIYQK
jgi:hypothetical protein